MEKNYVMLHVKTYDVAEGEPEFVLAISYGPVYFCRDMTEWSARQLARHIQEVLGDEMPIMQPEDIGMPESDIIF